MKPCQTDTIWFLYFYSEKDQIAFVGDSIYRGCIGDYQYPGGDYDLLLKNVKEKILTLPEQTALYSGHSEPTTVGEEKPSYFVTVHGNIETIRKG